MLHTLFKRTDTHFHYSTHKKLQLPLKHIDLNRLEILLSDSDGEGTARLLPTFPVEKEDKWHLICQKTGFPKDYKKI